jgi:M6 family metalloprotease-like protein
MKRTLSFIIALVLIILGFSIAFAIPASPGLKEVKMPDGTTMQVRLIGDERVSWLETADGYTILRNPYGYYEYAKRDNSGRLVPSGIKAGQKPLPAKKHIRQSREFVNSRIKSMKMQPGKVVSPSQITGTEKVIVLLVEFADVTHESPAHDPSYFDFLYFGTNIGQLNHYLQDISYNQLDITGDIGPWVSSIQNMAYYGYGQDPGLTRIQNLVREAVIAADATVDFSQYDQDSNNSVDHLIIVHAGGDYASTSNPDDIWSHSWAITPYLTDDDVYVSSYAMSSEDDPMGVQAHEFLHDLGAPDLYDYDYDGNPVGEWCIMDSGAWAGDPYGSVPTGICGYLRYDLDAVPGNGYTGWLNANTLTLSGDYLITQLHDTAGDRLYRIDIPSDNEYFLIENRELLRYDASLPDTGIVIYHVDEDMPDSGVPWTLNDGTPTNSFYRISVENPGGDFGKLDAAYSQSDGQVSFNNTSTPNSDSNQGINSDISITAIGPYQSTMVFTLSLTGDPAPLNNSPTVSVTASPTSGTVPLSVTFSGTATDSDGTIVSYHYNFGDGGESGEEDPVYIFNAVGEYTVTFTATDNDSAFSSDQVDISVTAVPVNNPPTVGVTASPTSGTVPLSVTFSGTATDSDGTIVSYHYDFGDGGESSQEDPVYIFNAAGIYTVTFTATDDDGASSSAEAYITVTTTTTGGGSGGGCGTISGFDLKPPSSGQIILDIMFFMIPMLVILGKRVYKVIRYR